MVPECYAKLDYSMTSVTVGMEDLVVSEAVSVVSVALEASEPWGLATRWGLVEQRSSGEHIHLEGSPMDLIPLVAWILDCFPRRI